MIENLPFFFYRGRMTETYLFVCKITGLISKEAARFFLENEVTSTKFDNYTNCDYQTNDFRYPDVYDVKFGYKRKNKRFFFR